MGTYKCNQRISAQKYAKNKHVQYGTCTAALAVPEILCVNGEVAFTCITVTNPIAKPIHPVTVIQDQNTNDVNFSKLLNNISVSNNIINGRNKKDALKLL